jgi:hypothetical protein
MKLPPRAARFLATAALVSGAYGAIGWEIDRLGFTSNASAFLIEKALVMHATGTLESAGFVYPPIPLLIAYVLPSAWALTAVSCVAVGVLGATLLLDRSETSSPRALNVLLLGAALFTPVSLYLGTQEVSASLGMLLIYLSFRAFVRYTRGAGTEDLFVSGLWMGAAFFTVPIAVYFAVGYASWVWLSGPDRSFAARGSALAVLLFPLGASMATWAYLSWLFVHRAQLLYPSALLVDWTWPQAAEGSLAGLVATAWTLWWDPPAALITLLPVAAMALAPQVGVGNLLQFITLNTVVGISLLPQRLTRAATWTLAAAALVQGVGNYVSPVLRGEAGTWQEAWFANALPPAEALDVHVARRLAQAPRASILTDDRMATYRLVAQAGTVSPFVLPTDADFSEVAAAPAAFVPYLLVGGGGAASPLARYLDAAPAGMVLEASFGGYKLYRDAHAPSLLAQSRPTRSARSHGSVGGLPDPGRPSGRGA